ncbi:prophage protein [Secundilactobacillus pentosiphilus]|uniref:Prophage protein n=1 Tax=Secundilactobacillus pentosiphilus TaxID=1714682 RepID=A0A1Z5IZL9_9LACO|nr:prophage endopeptidase tail family protein [Secundilactobacillus pentosiphilus]GAX07213.1 prophage protein [Secundilactobacillus pentosiphilus]
MAISHDYIIVQDEQGKYDEILTDLDYSSFEYDYEQNSSRTLQFTVYKTPLNEFAYNLTQNESVVTFQGQDFVVKQATQTQTGYVWNKQVTAQHVSYAFQDWTAQTVSQGKTWQLQDALDFICQGNDLGYTLDFQGKFTTVKLDQLGTKSALEDLQDIVTALHGIMFADNKHITIYDEDSFYQKVDKTFREVYNTEDVEIEQDTSNLKTRVKVFGPKKSTKDINYQQVKCKDMVYSGDWSKDKSYTTSKGARVRYTITAQNENDILTVDTENSQYGGIFDVYLDDKKIDAISTYSGSPASVDVSTTLSKGDHEVELVFAGDDPKHVMKTLQDAHNKKTLTDAENSADKAKKHAKKDDKIPDYVGKAKKAIAKSKTWVARGTVGDKNHYLLTVKLNPLNDSYYKVVGTYIDPIEKNYGHSYWFSPLHDNSAKTVDDLMKYAQKQLASKIVPTVTMTLSYRGQEDINEREMWVFEEPSMGYHSIDERLMTLNTHHPYYFQPGSVGFTNDRNSLVKLQSQLYSEIRSTRQSLTDAVDPTWGTSPLVGYGEVVGDTSGN